MGSCAFWVVRSMRWTVLSALFATHTWSVEAATAAGWTPTGIFCTTRSVAALTRVTTPSSDPATQTSPPRDGNRLR